MADNALLTRVLRSIFFRRSSSKASRYVRSSKGIFELIRKVAAKSSSLGMSGSYAAAKDQINLLVRMLRAYARGEYKAVPHKTLVSAAAVLLYFVSPVDLILDLLPVVGFADDIALILWLVRNISGDLDRFRQWEEGQKTIKMR